ncbi:hypothetical protein [Nocardia sp. NPDC003345]
MPALTTMFDHAPRTRSTDPGTPASGRMLVGFWIVSIALISLLLALL